MPWDCLLWGVAFGFPNGLVLGVGVVLESFALGLPSLGVAIGFPNGLVLVVGVGLESFGEALHWRGGGECIWGGAGGWGWGWGGGMCTVAG